MKAPIPSAIRCPHCRKKIRVRGVGAYLVVYLLVAVAFATVLIIARRRNQISDAAMIVLAVIGLLLLEFITSIIVLRRAKFEKPERET
jgi:FtsH-binding integral membrane protein